MIHCHETSPRLFHHLANLSGEAINARFGGLRLRSSLDPTPPTDLRSVGSGVWGRSTEPSFDLFIGRNISQYAIRHSQPKNLRVEFFGC